MRLPWIRSLLLWKLPLVHMHSQWSQYFFVWFSIELKRVDELVTTRLMSLTVSSITTSATTLSQPSQDGDLDSKSRVVPTVSSSATTLATTFLAHASSPTPAATADSAERPTQLSEISSGTLTICM